MVRWIACWALLLISPWLQATELSAQVDKNPAMQGEEIILQLTIDDKVAGDALDASVLEDDFRVVGPSIAQSMQIINGQSSQTTTWRFALVPKRIGRITIPAFNVAGATSTPIQLEVIAASSAQSQGAQPKLFLQAAFSANPLYVQQVGYLELKIFFQGDLQRGNLSQPQVEGVNFEQIGKDVEGSELVNGERYQTITRRYTVVAQRSGQFKLPAPFFKGELIDRSAGNYDFFARTQTLTAEGNPLTLDVKPAPANFPGAWLTADLVTLTEEWSVDPKDAVQGEPITRTLTLTAIDLHDDQLPELPVSKVTGLRQYPEQPQSRKADRKGRLVAQKTISIAIIPEQPGQFTLPAIEIPWFNSHSETIERAALPAQTLVVASNGQAESSPVSAEATPRENAVPAPVTGFWNASWQWTYSTSVCFGLWLVTMLYGLSRRLTRAEQPAHTLAANPSEARFNLRRFKQACLDNDEEHASLQLLRWGRQTLSVDCHDLSQLAALLPEGLLKQQVLWLSNYRYQATPTRWLGQPLFEAFAQVQHQQRVQQATELAPLYPEPSKS